MWIPPASAPARAKTKIPRTPRVLRLVGSAQCRIMSATVELTRPLLRFSRPQGPPMDWDPLNLARSGLSSQCCLCRSAVLGNVLACPARWAPETADDALQLRLLRLAEVVPEESSDPVEVRRCRLEQLLEAGLGDGRVDDARVGVAAFPPQQTAASEPVDESREPARAQDDRVREVAHPQPAFVVQRELDKDVVGRQRQVVRRDELAVER